MRYPSALLAFLLCIAVSNAVPCNDLWSVSDCNGNNAAPAKYPNPFDPQGRWQVIKSEDCLLRFQTPGQRGSTSYNLQDSRVTKLNWDTTPQQVSNTMNSYNNAGGANAMLWLSGDLSAYQYAGILRNLGQNWPHITPQSGLNQENTVISFLLPSGKQKIHLVGPNECNENTRRAMGSGISGTISSTDYAYGTVQEARMGLKCGMYGKGSFSDSPTWAESAYMLAEDPNGDCVVIDFRTIFPNYPW